MDLWFHEKHTSNCEFRIKIKKQLFSEKSKFQQIDVFDTYEFGKMLVLDGCVMITQKDEFIYHEMICHIPMSVNSDIKNVLVIGAGDGGTIRELCKYQKIQKIDLVEIDQMVLEISKIYLPFTASHLDDPRVRIFFEDGLKFVRASLDIYDLIIIDSTDPFGPSEGLFTKEFYFNCNKILSDNGIVVNQRNNVFYTSYTKILSQSFNKLSEIFPINMLYCANIPTYPAGHWLFGYSSKSLHPLDNLDEIAWNNLCIKTKYYNTNLHKASFCLPNYIKELFENEN